MKKKRKKENIRYVKKDVKLYCQSDVLYDLLYPVIKHNRSICCTWYILVKGFDFVRLVSICSCKRDISVGFIYSRHQFWRFSDVSKEYPHKTTIQACSCHVTMVHQTRTAATPYVAGLYSRFVLMIDHLFVLSSEFTTPPFFVVPLLSPVHGDTCW